MKRAAPPVPTEEWEQLRLLEWAIRLTPRFPELGLLFHIPNSGKKHINYAAKQKKLGLKSGVPDLMLPIAKKGYHGLFLEMKRRKGGVLSVKQKAWAKELERQGYGFKVCYGWEAAADLLVNYLSLPK